MEPVQFLYSIARPAPKLNFTNGHCRLCGGKLFTFQKYEPEYYSDVIGDTWKQEFLTRNKSSDFICPACSYVFGNIGYTTKEENTDPGKPKVGLFKADRRGELNKEGKPRAIASIIASEERGFQLFGFSQWKEFGENLINPPEPPFLMLASTDFKRGIQYGPWQSIIALTKETYPVFFNYSVKTAGGEVLNSTMLWINPVTFKKAIDIASLGKKVPKTPDWELAQKCAVNNKEEK